MNFSIWLAILLSCSFAFAVFSDDQVFHGRKDEYIRVGLLKTLEAVEADAIAKNVPWAALVPVIRNGITNQLAAADITTLRDCVYNLPDNAPGMLGDLASIAWYNQSGDVDDVISRMQSGNERLVMTALSTADIMPYQAAYRDALFQLIKDHASFSSFSSAAPFSFALRNYNRHDDAEVLRKKLKGQQIRQLMRQAIFYALLDQSPNENYYLAREWIRDLFLEESDYATLKLMCAAIAESDVGFKIELLQQKRSSLQKMMDLLDTTRSSQQSK